MRLSPSRRYWENSTLREENTWRVLFERSRTNLWNLLLGAIGSRQAAEKVFERIFVTYAKECVDRQELPSATALLRRAVPWLREAEDTSAPPRLRFLPNAGTLANGIQIGFLGHAHAPT